jgi:hypothetical protein
VIKRAAAALSKLALLTLKHHSIFSDKFSGSSPMNGKAHSPSAHSGSPHCSLTESLEQLAAASQRLADLAAEALGLDEAAQGNAVMQNTAERVDVETARQILLRIFDASAIEQFDGSEAMEKARVAHLNAALEMYIVMHEDTLPRETSQSSHMGEDDLASRIGQALFKELLEYYGTSLRGNDRVTFTTEQRTALESAFLVKPKLNTAEKRALAKTCNLSPRQVEVWVRALYVQG